jgi:hypothetical protein
MGKYLKKFENHTEYEGARQNLILPNVSLCAQENEVHYNPFFCKLTLSDDRVVKLEGSGELTNAMVSSQYKNNLVSAEIGELCTSIGSGAFNGCSSLTEVTIPDSVTSIGQGAFGNCSSLSTITSHIMNAPSVNPGTFQDVKNGGTLYVPIGSSGYETWMNKQANLGLYNWTKVEQ